MTTTVKQGWDANPSELIYMGVFYIFGFIILKHLTKGKEPVKLHNVKLVYNLVMSVFSFYVFYGVLHQLIANYSTKSQHNPLVCDESLELLKGMEWYFQIFYYSKYIEFVDTFFLVMAGVANPSVKMGLHLYHHLVTPSIVYTTWFYPCTGGWVGPLTNGFVHVLMYAYYGISVLNPKIKKYGNLITYVQLTQFIGVILYHFVWVIPTYLRGCSSGCSGSQLTYNFSQYIVFLVLFFAFFKTKNSGSAKNNGIVTNGIKANGHTLKKAQ